MNFVSGSVRPRVHHQGQGDSFLLEDILEDRAQEASSTVVEILGNRGAGKSSAAQYLLSLPIADRLLVIDDADHDIATISRKLSSHDSTQSKVIVLFATRAVGFGKEVYQLCDWTKDDLIELVLATCHDQCSRIMTQINDRERESYLAGHPVLYGLVVERLSASPNQKESLRVHLSNGILDLCKNQKLHHLIEEYCLSRVTGRVEFGDRLFERLEGYALPNRLLQSLECPTVQRIFAAQSVASSLRSNEGHRFPYYRLTDELLEELRLSIADDELAMKGLQKLANGGHSIQRSMAATVLYRIHDSWKPSSSDSVTLKYAQLSRINWDGLSLSRPHFDQVDLSHGSFHLSRWKKANLQDTSFTNGNLSSSVLHWIIAQGCHFRHIQLDRARINHSRLVHCQFTQARMPQTRCRRTQFSQSDLRHLHAPESKFERCVFKESQLSHSSLTKSDFSHSSLRECEMMDVDLSQSNLSATSLYKCNLENARADESNWRSATFRTVNLTGSHFRRSSLINSKIVTCQLADVDWEGADLRKCSLISCNFHLGSTRCGLVDSPYPSHGTRTGFYTDDYDAQWYEQPEQIRKANLRGVDLRGAVLDSTDFYLVDLRDARLDPHQLDYLRRCKAILSE